MNALIVHAHPEPKSFCTTLKTCAAETLASVGYDVVVSDLHASGFKAVADAADFRTRRNPDHLVYALEQRHAVAQGALAPDIAAELEKLRAADLVVFNFPLYWFSVPAILKGWFDRVLVSGVVYGGKRFYDRGGLAGKKGLITVTMGSREHMFGPQAIHGEIEPMLRHITRGTLHYVGMSVLPPFFAHHVPYVSDEERARLLDHYRRRLLALDRDRPLRFPTLDAFDDTMAPRVPTVG